MNITRKYIVNKCGSNPRNSTIFASAKNCRRLFLKIMFDFASAINDVNQQNTGSEFA